MYCIHNHFIIPTPSYSLHPEELMISRLTGNILFSCLSYFHALSLNQNYLYVILSCFPSFMPLLSWCKNKGRHDLTAFRHIHPHLQTGEKQYWDTHFQQSVIQNELKGDVCILCVNNLYSYSHVSSV
jgi:hypothetical protein